MNETGSKVGAVILAAGMSTRMGQPKMLLPWGGVTVIEKVVSSLLAGGVRQPVVVTGSGHAQICEVLKNYPVRQVFNPLFQDGEMLHSLQAGMAALEADCRGMLMVLGDQPQMEAGTVQALLQEFSVTPANLIIPSFQMRRGHPWLIGRSLWGELLAQELPQTLRDFLKRHSTEIQYLNVDTPSVLADIDTPDDYQKYKP